MRAFCSSSFCIVEVFSVARRRYGCGPFSAVSRECDSAVFSRMTICSPLLTTVRTSKPFRAACVISFCNVPVSLVARSRILRRIGRVRRFLENDGDLTGGSHECSGKNSETAVGRLLELLLHRGSFRRGEQ